MTNKPIQLISDQAIADSNNIREDSLEFSTYADVISRVVRRTRGPFTVGIFGEWGMGKTSLMRLVEQDLLESNNDSNVIIPIWFNAWMFERVDYPIIPLIKAVIKSLEKYKTVSDKAGNTVSALITALEALAYAFKINAKLGIPGNEVGIEFSPGIVSEKFTSRRRQKSKIPENVDHYEKIFAAFDKISDKIVPSNITLVVMIDDLDRCFPENSVRLLENIKLILSQPGFFFMIGASRGVIEDYLQFKYKDQLGVTGLDGRAYLDKMIQMTFDIPPHASRIDDFTKNIIKGLEDKKIKKALRPLSAVIAEVCKNNPRTIIRFINRLITDDAIYQLKKEDTLTTNLPVSIFAVTRSLQQSWKDIYGLLVSGENLEDREYCTVVSQWNDEYIRLWVNYKSENYDTKTYEKLLESIKTYSLVDGEVLKQIATYLSGDRTLKSLLFQEVGVQWLTKHNLREASISFLMAQPAESSVSIQGNALIVKSTIDSNLYKDPDEEMYETALQVIVDSGRASSSLLQRRLRIGYARAARIIETMELQGIISAADGARPRDVLVKDVEEAKRMQRNYEMHTP